MNDPAFFPIESLTLDPDLQVRVEPNDEAISTFAEQMGTEDEMKKFPPIEIYYDGVKYWLGDGHQRCAGAEKAGHDKVWAVVKNGTRADALWGAILGNSKQGFGLTRADRQRATILAISQWPERSNVMLADAIGCSECTIRRYREQHPTSSNDEVGTLRRIGKDGRTRPAQKTSTKTKSPTMPEPSKPESPSAEGKTISETNRERIAESMKEIASQKQEATEKAEAIIAQKAIPAVKQAVDSGELTAATAAIIAEHPQEEQQALLDQQLSVQAVNEEYGAATLERLKSGKRIGDSDAPKKYVRKIKGFIEKIDELIEFIENNATDATNCGYVEIVEEMQTTHAELLAKLERGINLYRQVQQSLNDKRNAG